MAYPDVQLETGRSILRPPRLEDFDRYAELMADADDCRHIGGHLPRAAAWRKFLQMPGAWAVQGFAMLSVLEQGRGLARADGSVAAGKAGRTEIGDAFHPGARGHGYAFESVVAAIDWAFNTLGWERIVHCIAPDNLGSQALARRLGSTRRGPAQLPPPAPDVVVELWGAGPRTGVGTGGIARMM